MPGTRPMLLVVDDEPDVAAVMAEFATRAGYEVVTTSRPWEFDLFYSDAIDVIVLDLWMPGVDGIELIRRLAAKGSRAGLVLVSGFDRRVLDAARRLAESHGLTVLGSLSKPVRLGDLTTVLDAAAPAPHAVARAIEITSAELQRAIDEDQLEVHFQPQVSVRSGQVIGVEALVRWRRADNVLLPPEMFVQIAETADLAQALTWRVLDKVAHSALFEVAWSLSVSVNLPPAALTDVSFPDRVVREIEGTAVTPERLHFELTETSIADEPRAALDILTRLRLKGFSLAIDDFGTGYASFDQLAQLPVSALKIDKSFVRRMEREHASRSIVDSCVTLGHDLGLTVIAEGAETETTWRALREAGCDVIQGYLVMKPAPADVVAAWLPSWSLPVDL